MPKFIGIGVAIVVISFASTYISNVYLSPDPVTQIESQKSNVGEINDLYTRLVAAETKINMLQEDLIQSENVIRSLRSKAEKPVASQSDDSSLEKNLYPSPKEQAETADREFAEHKQKELDAFNTEPIDFSWSLSAESELENVLLEEADLSGFQLVSSQCKTTRCKAVVEFGDYESALEKGTQLAEVVIPDLNCMQSIYMPEPADASATYQAELMLNCASQ